MTAVTKTLTGFNGALEGTITVTRGPLAATFDLATLPAASIEYLLLNGATQSLVDAIAGEAGTERDAAWTERAAAIRAGTVRMGVGRGPTEDATLAEYRKLAATFAASKGFAKASAITRKDYPTAEAVTALVKGAALKFLADKARLERLPFDETTARERAVDFAVKLHDKARAIVAQRQIEDL